MIFFEPLSSEQVKVRELLKRCGQELDLIWDTNMADPDLDTYACSRDELIEAIQLAPDELTRQILYADLRFREWLTMVMGWRKAEGSATTSPMEKDNQRI